MTAPPGPPGRALSGHVHAFRADPLRFLEGAVSEHGDIVGLRAGRQPAILLRHPDHIQHVLQAHQGNYPKRTSVLDRLGRVLGRGLVNSDGDLWRQQRRRLQPFFHRAAIGGYVDAMAAQVRAVADRWADRCGEEVDVARDMMGLAFGMVGQTLLGLDLRADTEPVREAVMCLETQTNDRVVRLLDWPLWLPTRSNRAFRRAVHVLDRCVHRIIAAARSQGAPSPLLSALLESGDHDDTLVRDELVTLLLAGHENTGNALTWMWYLVARDPATQAAVREEAVRACGERDPTAADLGHLPLARAVVAEALRLYPPSWLNLRRARRGDTIAGYRIPAGAWMLISPYLTHRHPDFWPAPAMFDPGRFAGTGRTAHPHPFAYLPFGDGPRKCIGSHFAIAEMTVALSMLSARFHFAPLHPGSVEPEARVSLLPRGGLRLRVTASSAVPAS